MMANFLNQQESAASEPEDSVILNDDDTDTGEESEERVFGRRPLQYSRAYKRFFEGWEEHEVMVAPGKFRTERVYVADYYTIHGGRRRKCRMAVCYLILLAGILTFFFFASAKDAVFNYTWYAAITQTLSLASWLWMLVAILSWLFASLNMTLGEMRSGPKAILRSTIAGIATNALAAVICLLQILLAHGENVGQQLLFAVIYAACGLMALLIRRLEQSNEYVAIPQ